jgi:hypothetical protein
MRFSKKLRSEKLKGRDRLGNLGVDGRIILKRILVSELGYDDMV